MRLKLTEEQLHNLYRGLDLVEQSSASGTTTGQTLNPSTGTNVDNEKMEKDSPNLQNF